MCNKVQNATMQHIRQCKMSSTVLFYLYLLCSLQYSPHGATCHNHPAPSPSSISSFKGNKAHATTLGSIVSVHTFFLLLDTPVLSTVSEEHGNSERHVTSEESLISDSSFSASL